MGAEVVDDEQWDRGRLEKKSVPTAGHDGDRCQDARNDAGRGIRKPSDGRHDGSAHFDREPAPRRQPRRARLIQRRADRRRPLGGQGVDRHQLVLRVHPAHRHDGRAVHLNDAAVICGASHDDRLRRVVGTVRQSFEPALDPGGSRTRGFITGGDQANHRNAIEPS